MNTAGRSAMDFLLSFFVVGFILWLMSGILPYFRVLSETGTLYTMANYFWYGFPIAFGVLAIFWLINAIKEWRLVRRL